MARSAGLRWTVVGLASIAVAAGAAYWVLEDRNANPDASSGILQPSKSELVNVSEKASYVGTQACAECHADRYASYRQTAHSRSFNKIDVANEPKPGEFFDAASGRHYEVRHEGQKILHREWLQTGERIEAQHVVRYLVGSGRHTRTYLIEDSGFLAESPITWYQSRGAWGLSPGYEMVNQGFERGADLGCLFCHTGRVETVGGSDTRLVFHELSIGCEQCHGAGESHVKLHRSRGNAETLKTRRSDEHKDSAESIIHPAKLSRKLAEAICANCHLTSEAMVLARGKQVADFRPGSPLNKHRIDYRLNTPRGEMKVVGHVEQMRLSKCYQRTTTLTCTTCHDPHNPLSADEQGAYYRQKCVNCHTPDACGLKEQDRRRLDVQDDCVQCHMPTTKTDIPHVAFTHHRIDVHKLDEQKTEDLKVVGALVPYDDLAQWPPSERERFLGLAYFELLGHTAWEPGATEYRGRAREVLEGCRERGDVDGDTLAALAKLQWEGQSPGALDTALEALRAKDLFWYGKQTALEIVGKEYLKRDEPGRAIRPLEQLVKLRRQSSDWTLLGISRAKIGDLPGAVEAARRAVEIQPFHEGVRRVTAEILHHAGQDELAAREAAIADILSQNRENAKTESSGLR